MTFREMMSKAGREAGISDDAIAYANFQSDITSPGAMDQEMVIKPGVKFDAFYRELVIRLRALDKRVRTDEKFARELENWISEEHAKKARNN